MLKSQKWAVKQKATTTKTNEGKEEGRERGRDDDGRSQMQANTLERRKKKSRQCVHALMDEYTHAYYTHMYIQIQEQRSQLRLGMGMGMELAVWSGHHKTCDTV